MLTRVCAAVGAWFLVAPSVAQVAIGARVHAPQWSEWLRGEPVAVAAEAAPAAAVFAFYAGRPHLLRADEDYLVDLQRRFAARGLRVVAVVGDRTADQGAGWPGCALALDREQRVGTGWLGGRGRDDAYVVLLDGTAQVAFVGTPGSGLVDALERVLEDRLDVEREARLRTMRRELPARFDDAAGEATAAALAPLLRLSPRDGLLQGLCYLTLQTKVGDAEGAGRRLSAAIAAMAGEPRPLAVFADLVLRGDPQRDGVVRALVPSLLAAAQAAPRDPAVQLVCLRALLLAGRSREAGRLAMRCRKVVLETATGCLDFATLLASDENPAIWRDLADIALARARKLGADERLLAAARYTVLLRCAEDEAAAKQVRNTYVQDKVDHVVLNNDAWYFMTRLDTMGRYDRFAAALVELMLERREALDYFEFDTAALAMFLTGRVGEAIELQETALQMSGGNSPEYADRLRRYRARKAAAPR